MKINSIESFETAKLLKRYNLVTHCKVCKQKFSTFNVRTPHAWSMTQTDHVCEDCFEHECNQRLCMNDERDSYYYE